MDDLFSTAAQKSYTVSELTSLIKGDLESRFSSVWVEGEISNFRNPQSGHYYLTLKDASAQIRAVIFRSAARALKFTPSEGQQVLCKGRITVYEPKGEYQIVLESVEPRGIGSLQLAFEQLKEKLRQKGYFDPVRKRPIPAFPRRIGIITSPTGAAIRDMLNIIERRHPAVDILICPVPVQGAEAAPAIVRAIEELNRIGGVDVLIVGRGGGSLEDLWAFNEEVVAEAIFKSALPVISAVGHETDVTISDFVADLRAPTPSAAAELVVKNHLELIEKNHLWRSRLLSAFRNSVKVRGKVLEGLQKRLIDPKRFIENQFQRCDDLTERLSLAARRLVDHRQMSFENSRRRLYFVAPSGMIQRSKEILEQRISRISVFIRRELTFKRKEAEGLLVNLRSLSPLEILKRGYSITRKEAGGNIVRSNRDVAPDDSLEILLGEGRIFARVIRTIQPSAGDAENGLKP